MIFADLKLRPEAQKAVDAYSAPTSVPRALFVETDVTNWTDLSRLFAVAETEFGGVDLACPGAGVFEPMFSNFWHPPGVPGGPSRDPVDGHGHYAAMDINVTHVIRLTQLAISSFLNPAGDRKKASPQNPKRVVCIASIASEMALLSAPLYIASKWCVSGFVRSLAMLDDSNGIKVSAVAPGIVKTPLWTDAPEKITFIDESADEWVTTTEVAGAMLKLAEDPAMPGGTVLEIGHNHTRDIPLANNPGPVGAGHTLTNAAVGIHEVFDWLNTAGVSKLKCKRITRTITRSFRWIELPIVPYPSCVRYMLTLLPITFSGVRRRSETVYRCSLVRSIVVFVFTGTTFFDAAVSSNSN